MPNNTLDKAIAAVPKFRDRISLFTKKLRLAQYADGSIYDYRLKIAQAVLFFKKLPEEFTQTDSISPLQRPHYFTSSYTYLFSKKVILLSFLGWRIA